MKIQLILSGILIVAWAFGPVSADVVRTKPKIKNLDLGFSCEVDQVPTLDECYYSGIHQLNMMGCHLKGDVSAANCDVSSDEVNLPSGQTHTKKEWVCSVGSINCKETLNDPCPVNYREVNRFGAEMAGDKKVFLNFLSYCVFDAQNGRKDQVHIRQNAPLQEH